MKKNAETKTELKADYKRFEVGADYEPLGENDLKPIIAIGLNELNKRKAGRKPKFENNENGLNDFCEKTIEYLQHVQKVNENPDFTKRLIPDIESWAAYLGITRKTINEYELTRGKEWAETIAQIKNIIAACKKQLLLTSKIPAVVGIFDFTNNHGYINSSEFKLTPIQPIEEKEKSIEAQIEEAGLVWNEEKGDFEPKGAN